MRFVKSSRTLLPLAFSALLATCAWTQDHPNVQPSAVRDQLNQPGAASSQPPSAANTPAPQAKPAPTAQAPAKAAKPAKASKPAKAPKAPAKTEAKAPEKTPVEAKPATEVAADAPAKPPVEKATEDKPVVRRDPFDTLLTKARASNAPPENLPPGKAGLVVDTLRINGIVHSPNGMVAIVSNSQQRVYFLREGDKLYDGDVDKISLDGISFHEVGKDAFGKPLERTVNKRLYPSPGEQQ